MDGLLEIFTSFEDFLLVFTRSLGLIAVAPIIGSQNLPPQVKVGLGFILSILMLPVVSGGGAGSGVLQFFLAAAGELLIGLMLGFVFSLVFATIHLAGQFIDVRMGFAIANVVDPQFQTQVPLVGQFKYLMTAFVFLITDLHHFLLQSLYRTFELIPLGSPRFEPGMGAFLIRATARIFLDAFRIALPLMGVLFVIDISFGIVARAVPQMNVFILGFPVKILAGLLTLALIMPYFISGLGGLFGWMRESTRILISLLA